MEKILESKKAMRRELSALPIAEKLAILDRLRERAQAISAASADSKPEEQTSQKIQ
jgi:hypothetical protein